MMDKPLKDWTLGEMQEYCDNTNTGCQNACWLYAMHCYCPFKDEVPGGWDLSDPPRWTAEDIADANAVNRLYPFVTKIERDKSGAIKIAGGGQTGWFVDSQLFLSLKEGETVDLQEILDAEGKENG